MTLFPRACFSAAALAAICVLPARAQNPTDAAPPIIVRETEIDRQVKAIASELRCVVCKGQSLQDSPADFAQDMRAIIREQLEKGQTPEQVKAYFMERYGEWVLLEPPAKGFNLLLYIAPIALLVGGGAFVYFKAKSLTRAGASDSSQAMSPVQQEHLR
jgi:cytochrome c-type biogenesis protein CcmH